MTDSGPTRITDTVYDAKGRVQYSDDPHFAGHATDGTETFYDDNDRVIATQRLSNLVINVTTGPLTINGISLVNCSNSIRPTFVDCATVMGLNVVSGGGAGTLATELANRLSESIDSLDRATLERLLALLGER